MFDFSQLFHVGIRVPDLAAAMDELGETMGATWASVQDRAMSVWIPGQGQVTYQLALTYSVEGPVHLELMQGPAGTIWDGDDRTGAHHFGVWTDDVQAHTQALIDVGWTLELSANSPEDGYGRFSYVRSPQGVLVEPVSVTSRPRFERWWAGGSLN